MPPVTAKARAANMDGVCGDAAAGRTARPTRGAEQVELAEVVSSDEEATCKASGGWRGEVESGER